LTFFLWERHPAAMIVAGSHSYKNSTSLPTGYRRSDSELKRNAEIGIFTKSSAFSLPAPAAAR
jgi:hypothetical protein